MRVGQHVRVFANIPSMLTSQCILSNNKQKKMLMHISTFLRELSSLWGKKRYGVQSITFYLKHFYRSWTMKISVEFIDFWLISFYLFETHDAGTRTPTPGCRSVEERGSVWGNSNKFANFRIWKFYAEHMSPFDFV